MKEGLDILNRTAHQSHAAQRGHQLVDAVPQSREEHRS
jgi:hypothetical protein